MYILCHNSATAVVRDLSVDSLSSDPFLPPSYLSSYEYTSGQKYTRYMAAILHGYFQNQTLVDAHTEALQKVIEEYDRKVRNRSTRCVGSLHEQHK